jgi:hypothetical protein
MEPFRIVIQPHVPFPLVPIPAEVLVPVTYKGLSPAAWIVMFESDEHSIPAFPSAIGVIVFVAAAMSVAELAEIMTDAVVLRLMSSKIRVTSLFLISIPFVIEVPVTTIVSAGSCVAVSQVRFPAVTHTGATVMLQVMMKMK